MRIIKTASRTAKGNKIRKSGCAPQRSKTILLLENLEARDCPSYFVDAPNTGILPTNLNENNSVSWVDVNGDGRPDLWIGGEVMAQSGQAQAPNLYINNGNGTFTDAFASSFPPGNALTQVNDAEGSVWGDIFNTGTPDMLEISGGVGGKHFSGSYFYVNRQGQLTEEAPSDGLTNGVKAGRMPVFLDWNHDGLLDALVFDHGAANGGPPILYQQTPTGFVNVTSQAGLSTLINDPGVVESVDLNGDGIPDLVVIPTADSGKAPLVFLANAGTPGYTLTPNYFPSYHDITDMAVGDFFNTGQNDIFFTRRNNNQSDVTQSGPNLIAAQLDRGPQTGFTFQSTGNLTFDLGQAAYSQLTGLTNQIFIGTQGIHPTGLPFTLDPNDPNNQGIMPHDPNNGQGLYLGYDVPSQTWQVFYAKKSIMSPFVLSLSQPATNLTPIGFDPSTQAESPVLLVYNPLTKKYENQTIQAGLGAPIAGGGVVAGDFNNDGLLDLYVSTENSLNDLGGILYLNNGNGTFTAVPGASAQPGFFFADLENHIGRRPISADFNGDGTLDIFLPNTKFETPSVNYYNAPNELLYNAPNGNHWIELNLQGVVSNRDGLGAIVHLTSGGVTQRRDVTGGKHEGAQNSNTVHFGLGQNTTIDQIVIDWPSGQVQTLTNVTVDQLMTIIEPGGHSLNQARPITVFSPNQTYSGSLDAINTQDFYRYTSAGPFTAQLTLNGQAQIQLLDQFGHVLAQSQLQNGQQVISVNEPVGTYYIEIVNSTGQTIPYSLNVNVIPLAPLVTNLAINPGAASTPPITITATAGLGIQTTGFVAGAEFFIDSIGRSGTGVAMTAQDGTFDQSTEGITGTIDGTLFTNLSTRHHVLYVHARDDQGNWGPIVAMNFLKDSLGPVTNQVAINPSQTSSPPTISARVSDKGTGLSKVQAAEYFIDTPGSPGTGTAMTLGKVFDGGVIRLVSATIDSTVFSQLSMGQHTIFIEGEDVLGNWGPLASSTFTIVAPGLPPDIAAGAWGGQVAAQKPASNPTETTVPDNSNSATLWRQQFGMWASAVSTHIVSVPETTVSSIAAIPGTQRHALNSKTSFPASVSATRIKGLETLEENE